MESYQHQPTSGESEAASAMEIPKEFTSLPSVNHFKKLFDQTRLPLGPNIAEFSMILIELRVSSRELTSSSFDVV